MIGLSSLSLDSYILINDAAGISIKDLLFLVWTKASFALGNSKEFQTKLRDSKRGSTVSLDLQFKQWENEIVKIDFYNDALVIADAMHLSLWNQKVLASVQVKDLKTFSLNPGFKPHICATLSHGGKVAFYDLNVMTKVDLPHDNITFITWSRKGKQIACGTTTGEIVFHDTNADLKKRISRPKQLSESYHVQYIEWLEDRSFLAIYVSQDNETFVFQILEDKETKQQSFMELEDPAASFGADRDPFYFCHVLKSWDFDNLLILANSASTDVGLIGSATDSSKLENWEALEAYQFTMPLDEEQDDTWPISTALDLYSDQVLPSLTPDQPPMPACPILWILNNKGMLLACDILSTAPLEKGIQYPSMVKEVSNTLSLRTVGTSSGKNIEQFSFGKQAPAPSKFPTSASNETKQTKEPAPAFNFSATAKPFSFPKSSTDTSGSAASKTNFSIPKSSTTNVDVKSEIRKESTNKPRNESLSVLSAQFNKAYKDFVLDMSKLSKFTSELNILAQSNSKSTLADISSISSQTQHLEEKLNLVQESLNKTEEHFEEVKSQLLHSWAKKEESERLLKILSSPDQTPKAANNDSLGPEAEELKKLLNRKKKRIESSVEDLYQVLEDLRNRADSQKRGVKFIGATQDWYTLCKTVQRITNSAIEANVTLDDLEKKMNQMSVSSSKENRRKENHSPSKSPYGLVKVEDVLAEDLGKILYTDSKSHNSHSNLIAFLMRESYTPLISKCTAARPNFRADILINGSSLGSAILEPKENPIKGLNALDNGPIRTLKNDLNGKDVEESEPNTTLGEKIKKLDSTPPAKNEYIKSSPKTESQTPQGGLAQELVPPLEPKSDVLAKGFAPPIPKKMESPAQPSFSSFSGSKPDTGFQAFVSPFPKIHSSSESSVQKPALPSSVGASLIKPKDKFDSKDDSENPFLVTSKIPASPFGGNGFKIPEPKSVIKAPQAPIFSFCEAPTATLEQKIPPAQLNQDSQGKDTVAQNENEIKTGIDNVESTTPDRNEAEEEVDSESSNESDKTGELVNEDDENDAENLSEIIPQTEDDEKAPNLDSLDFFESSKPKNIVNPMFAPKDHILNKDQIQEENKVGHEGLKVEQSNPKIISGSSDSIEIEITDRPSSEISSSDLRPDTKPSANATSASETKLPEASSGFGQSSNIFGKPAENSVSAFGQATVTTVAPTTPSFGQSDTLRIEKPALSTAPAFGQSAAFGTPSTIAQSGSAFGQASVFGTPAVVGQSSGFWQSSTFGTPNKDGQSTPSFGQSAPSFAQSSPAFGQTNSSFVQSTPVFKQGASGCGQPTPVFGQTPSFGNANNGTISETVNKSGASPSQGFGSFSKSAFGQSNFGFGSGSNSNSFAALSGVSSPSPAPSSFAGIAQSGFAPAQGFNSTSTPSTGPLGPGQSLAGNVAFGARSGIGSNAPSFGLAQPSFPNISGTQNVFGSSMGPGNPTFGGSASTSGFASFASGATPAASFGSFGNNQAASFGSSAQSQQSNSLFGSSSQGFGSGSLNSAGFGQNPNNSAFSQHRG